MNTLELFFVRRGFKNRLQIILFIIFAPIMFMFTIKLLAYLTICSCADPYMELDLVEYFLKF